MGVCTRGQKLSLPEPCKLHKSVFLCLLSGRILVGGQQESAESGTHSNLVVLSLDRVQLFLFSPSKEAQKAFRKRSHTQHTTYSEPGPLARGGASLPRHRLLRISASGSSPKRTAGRTGKNKFTDQAALDNPRTERK